MSYKDKAIKKLDKEYGEGKYNKYGDAVKGAVRDALKGFCEQDEEFAQAIVQTKGTFADCLAKIMKGCGASISDIEVYRRAVGFYFPGAKIDFKMQIDLVGDASDRSRGEMQGGIRSGRCRRVGSEARGADQDAVTSTGDAALPDDNEGEGDGQEAKTSAQSISLSLLDFI